MAFVEPPSERVLSMTALGPQDIFMLDISIRRRPVMAYRINTYSAYER
jgi:hypothetical protein